MWENLKEFSLDEQADWSEVKRTYIEQLKVWHPDRFENDEDLRKKCEERTKDLNQLFNKLKSQINELGKNGIDVQLDKPILPQLVHAGVVNLSKKQESTPLKPFEQEPLVGNRVNKVGSKQKTTEYEETFWSPQIIAAAIPSGLALLVTCFFIYQSYFAPQATKIIYGTPADLSKYAKKEVEQDPFTKKFEASIEDGHVRSGDGVIEGQLGGARIISGVTDKSVKKIPAIVSAASRCDLEGVKKAVDKGAAVNAEDTEGMSSLSWAAKANCEQLAKYLISKGANINHISSNGFTPIAWARWFKNIEVIKVLEIDSRHIVKKP